jgi:hypothetical protein
LPWREEILTVRWLTAEDVGRLERDGRPHTGFGFACIAKLLENGGPGP